MGSHFFCSGITGGYPPALWTVIIRTFGNPAYAVDCFFVISGFVITKMLVGEKQDFSSLDLRSFYIKRIARLFPLLAVVLLAGIIILATNPPDSYPMYLCFRYPNLHFGWAFWISILTFTFNWFFIFTHQSVSVHWAVLWSLAVEEQFYLFYPLVAKTLRNRKNIMIFLSGVILSAVLFRLGVFLWMPHKFSMSLNASFAVFDQIAVGAFIYFLLPSFKIHFEQKPWLGYFFLFAGLSIFLTVYYGTSIEDTGQLILAPTLVAFGTALMILGGIHIKDLYSHFWKILSWPGQLSYGGYLWHVTIMFLLWPVLSSMGNASPLLYYPSVGLACYASYRWFEIPANHFVRKIFGVSFS